MNPNTTVLGMSNTTTAILGMSHVHEHVIREEQ
jgi:hypothetical protein